MGQTRAEANRAYRLAVCGVMTAVLCVLAPVAIPAGPVPVTLATLAVYLMAVLLGWKWGTAGCLAYLAAGLAGMPVFSGYRAGGGMLLGPTGGYLVGYLAITLTAGWAAQRSQRRGPLLLGMLTGTALCYALGTAWYCLQSGTALIPALWACVLPFVPFDLVKMAAVLTLGPVLRRRLRQAGLLA